MRGLTCEERQHLNKMQAPGMTDITDDPAAVTTGETLVRQGRARYSEGRYEGEWCAFYEITDLGRLALRVCLVSP